MDRTRAILSGKEAPTVQDFIEWIREHAFNEGEIGLSLEPPSIQEIYNSYQPLRSDDEDEDDLDRCHITAMEERYAGTLRREAQAKILQSNQQLLVRTEMELDRRLLEAGIHPERLRQLSAQNPSLRRKVIELYRLTNCVKSPSGGVDAYLYLGEHYERRMVVYLPINASLAEVCWLLQGVCISEGMPAFYLNGNEPEREKTVWKYNLLAADKKTILRKSSIDLLTDEDYRNMIREITRKDVIPPTALITLVSIIDECSLWHAIDECRTTS